MRCSRSASWVFANGMSARCCDATATWCCCCSHTLGLLIAAEEYDHHLPVNEQLTLLACAVASAVIGFLALRGYFSLMREAEFAADQATCSQCEAYGRWDIAREDRALHRMQVRCRKCGHAWQVALFAPGQAGDDPDPGSQRR